MPFPDALERINTLEVEMRHLAKVDERVRTLERHFWMGIGGLAVLQTIFMFVLSR